MTGPKPEAAPSPPAKRQFQPGMRVVDSRKRRYYVDQHGALRRVDGAKLSKAGQKAAKRQRQAERAKG